MRVTVIARLHEKGELSTRGMKKTVNHGLGFALWRRQTWQGLQPWVLCLACIVFEPWNLAVSLQFLYVTEFQMAKTHQVGESNGEGAEGRNEVALGAEPSPTVENTPKPALVAMDPKAKKLQEIRSVVDKIAAFSKEFLAKKVYLDADVLSATVDMIYEKALDEPVVYSDLCKMQVDDEMREHGTHAFRNGLLVRSQRMFEEDGSDPKIQMLQEEMDEFEDPQEKAVMQKAIDLLHKKSKARYLGSILFIGEVGGDEESIECAVKLLDSVGKNWEPVSRDQIDHFILYLQDKSPNYSSRLRTAIAELAALRKNNWKPLRAEANQE
uniref:MIF4G domain-containing protein n=1 Tax=Steinernema glaseri TaxID=37863 RepID=A0A1I7Z1Z8_9BILA